MRIVILLVFLVTGFAGAQRQIAPALKGAPIPYPIVGLYNDGKYQIIMYLAGRGRDGEDVTGIIARDSLTGFTQWKTYASFNSRPLLSWDGIGNSVVVATSGNDFGACPFCHDRVYVFNLSDGKLIKSGYIWEIHISKEILLNSPDTDSLSNFDLGNLYNQVPYEITSLKYGTLKAYLPQLPDRESCGESKTVSNIKIDTHVVGDHIIVDRRDSCGSFHIILDWTTFPDSQMQIIDGSSKYRTLYPRP